MAEDAFPKFMALTQALVYGMYPRRVAPEIHSTWLSWCVRDEPGRGEIVAAVLRGDLRVRVRDGPEFDVGPTPAGMKPFLRAALDEAGRGIPFGPEHEKFITLLNLAWELR